MAISLFGVKKASELHSDYIVPPNKWWATNAPDRNTLMSRAFRDLGVGHVQRPESWFPSEYCTFYPPNEYTPQVWGPNAYFQLFAGGKGWEGCAAYGMDLPLPKRVQFQIYLPYLVTGDAYYYICVWSGSAWQTVISAYKRGGSNYAAGTNNGIYAWHHSPGQNGAVAQLLASFHSASSYYYYCYTDSIFKAYPWTKENGLLFAGWSKHAHSTGYFTNCCILYGIRIEYTL